MEVKRAIPRGEHYHQPNDSPHQSKPSTRTTAATARTKKIFVGGLSANLTQEEFRSYFEKFGKITDVVVMYDSTTHRPRGFGFITFESEDSADSAVETTFQTLNCKTVEVKKAIPRDGSGSDSTAARDKNNFYYTRSPSNSLRNGNGRGPILDAYSPAAAGLYPPYGPRLPGFHGYCAAPQLYPPYGEGYAFGASYGYGVPYASPRRAWNGAGGYVVAGRRSPLPYGGGNFFPGYFPPGGGSFFPGYMPHGNRKWTQANGGGGELHGVAGRQEETGKAEDR